MLNNLKRFQRFQKKLHLGIPNLLEIRCEIYIGKDDFANLKNNFANQEMLPVEA